MFFSHYLKFASFYLTLIGNWKATVYLNFPLRKTSYMGMAKYSAGLSARYGHL